MFLSILDPSKRMKREGKSQQNEAKNIIAIEVDGGARRARVEERKDVQVML